jgi:hypothetical protein
MRQLIILALMSLVCTVPAAAEPAQRLAKPAVAQDEVAASKPDQQQNDSQSTQSIERTLRNQLASAGLTDIEMVPTSFVVRAKAADGNPVVLLLYPDTDSEWQVRPLDSEDDHSTSSPN